MRKYIAWYISLSFVIGISFGYFYQTDTFQKITPQLSRHLTVLAPASLIPEDLFESYQVEHNIELEMNFYSSDAEFNQKISSNYDLILAPHTKIPELRASHFIKAIDINLLKNLVNVSADFRDLPTDPGGRYSIPLVWGINQHNKRLADNYKYASTYLKAGSLSKGLLFQTLISKTNAKINFMQNKDGDRQMPALWVQSFILPSSTENSDVAYDFIDFFLSTDVAIELAKLTNKSSTNITIEQTRLDAKLKPSHLRAQKFAQLAHPGQ